MDLGPRAQPAEAASTKLSIQGRWRPACKACALGITLFALVLAALWWLTPVQPYAALNTDTGMILFSPNDSLLVTSSGRPVDKGVAPPGHRCAASEASG
jgi:hypothetical protein